MWNIRWRIGIHGRRGSVAWTVRGGSSAEVPRWRGRGSWQCFRDRGTGKGGEWVPVHGADCCKVWDVARRGWSVNVLYGTQRCTPILSHACAWYHCTHTNEQALQRLCMKKCGVRQVYLSTFPCRLPGDEISGKRNDIHEPEKITVQSRMRFAKNPKFCSTSNRRAAPSVLTKTKVLVVDEG